MFWKLETFRAAKTRSAGRHQMFTTALLVVFIPFFLSTIRQGAAQAADPGVRGGPAGAGTMIGGLTPAQQAFFSAGMMNFNLLDSVTGSVTNTGGGLGPRFNAESCGQCHAQPAPGGTSPTVNPQVAAATDQGAGNQVPFFIALNGPVREARFPYTADLRQADGGVHDLFTVTGRGDAPGCTLAQPNFQQAWDSGNLIFRIPTPTFGGGLIEAIPDSAIQANMNSNLFAKGRLRIAGRTNNSGNDGTVTRFGWKAQNKSLEVFSGEAYNVEVGVTNELFPNERDGTPGCQFNGTPEDATNFSLDGTALPSDIVRFTTFMRFLDQPQPAPATHSTVRGQQVFSQIGCALCHTPSFATGPSSVTALSNIQANLFSDLLIHHMGPKLADNVSQGGAGGDEFRTAPLWGLGQRIFFLHDGRTADLAKAIRAHSSDGDRHYPDSEANRVIDNFNNLSEHDKQDLLNFLRSL
jgi:CxxC motif-containing protein (DUF1111 family)